MSEAATPETALEELRRRIATLLAGLEHPPLGMAAALSEECGEVCRQLLERHAYGAEPDDRALGDELADVLICLCEIATHHGIDLGRAVARKLADVETKVPGWRADLGTALRRARGEDA